jgi:tetratricopeptide (TPR) repeat protein
MLERVESMADKQFRDLPDDRAVVLAMLGMYHSSLGASVKAEALLTRARESASGSKDASLKARLTCQHATILQDLGKMDEARRDLERAVDRTDIDGETAAECLAYLSYVARALNDGPRAVALTRRALDRLREVGRPMPMSQATLLGDLASGLELSGRYDEADLQFAAAMQLFSQLGRETGAEAITVLNNWGQVSLAAGDAKSALLRFDQLLALLEGNGGNAGGHHELSSRGAALLLLGRYRDALDSFERALVAAQADGHLHLQAYSLGGAGLALRELGELDRAEAYLRRLEALDAQARPVGGSAAAQEHHLRGRLALSRGDLPLARREFSLLLEDRKARGSTVNALLARAETGLREGRVELAATDAQEALRLARSMQGSMPHSVRTGQAWLLEGDVRARQGAPDIARDAYAAAVDHLSHSADPAHPALKRALALQVALSASGANLPR